MLIIYIESKEKKESKELSAYKGKYRVYYHMLIDPQLMLIWCSFLGKGSVILWIVKVAVGAFLKNNIRV